MTTALPDPNPQPAPEAPKLKAVPLEKLLVAESTTSTVKHFTDDVYPEEVQSQITLLRPPIVSKNADGNFRVIGNIRTAQWLVHQARLSGAAASKVSVVILDEKAGSEFRSCIEHQLLPMALEIASTRTRRKLRAFIKKNHRDLLPKPSNKTETLSPISGKNHR